MDRLCEWRDALFCSIKNLRLPSVFPASREQVFVPLPIAQPKGIPSHEVNSIHTRITPQLRISASHRSGVDGEILEDVLLLGARLAVLLARKLGEVKLGLLLDQAIAMGP